MGDERTTTEERVRDMLAGLRSGDAGAAWQQFLDRYSSALMRIVSQYDVNPERVNDCYIFVCNGLCDDHFRRLLSFKPEGAASFRSWLKVVVANLCIDYKRRETGRGRPFRNIEKMPPLEQQVFHYKFQHRMSLSACQALLEPSFPGLNKLHVADAVRHINSALSPHQQWLLSVRRPQLVSLSDALGDIGDLEPREQGPDPEHQSILDEESDRLERAMAQLPPRQRMLLKLRFQQDLTLKETARLARLGDPFKARREIQKALQRLESLLSR
jgi:RNA polymerase sigma factor (sigma-70 family)